jgi:hypothetical protein
MKLLRITDKDGLFLRDDFTFNEETEIALDVEASQGLYQPKWDFETQTWVEGATEIPTPAAEPQKSDEELLQELSLVVQQLKERGLI